MSRPTNRKTDLYDVSTYTDDELYGILELDNNPSDRVLEAKILSMIEKYNRIGNAASAQMSQFFIDVYTHFFDVYDEAENNQPTSKPATIERTANQIPRERTTPLSQPNTETQITNQVLYTKDTNGLNPLLKQTIKRTVSIDSQYRENKKSSSTNFTFNLSEPLRDVVSLKLYSVQIPYTWYTVNSSFGGNFFYIKGNSPGIDNGNHDYKIEIPSGNYTAVTLQSSIQNSINGLFTTYPDVNFGNTSISYNSSTVLSTINVNITEVFGESNYYLEFPNWSSPLDVSGRLTNLAGYFGYNNMVYNCGSSAFSNRTIQTANVPPIRIDSSNNTIQIVVYVGDAYDPSTVVATTNVVIPRKVDYSWTALITQINARLLANKAVDAARSGFMVMDVSADQQGFGFSYIQMNVKLTRAFIKNYENAKVAVILPDDSVVWVGDKALFGFPRQVIELSDVISETPILQTDYLIRRDVSNGIFNNILLECKTPGYITPENNFDIPIPASDENGYTLEEYLNAVNASILGQNTNSQLYVSNTNGTRLYSSADGKLNLNVYVNRVFDNTNYSVRFEGNYFPQLFGSVSGATFDLSVDNIFTGTTDRTLVTLDATDKLVIIPKNTHKEDGVDVPLPFVIKLVESGQRTFQRLYSTSTSDGLIDYINTRISSYTDLPGSTPLVVGGNINNGTNVSDNGSRNMGKLRLTVVVNKLLTYSDYRVKFVSNQVVNGVSNAWGVFLGFNPVYETIPGGVITNNTQVRGNEITLDRTNNYFYIKSFPEVDGLTSTGKYNIPITLPIYDIVNDVSNNSYTIEEVYEKINAAFDANPLSAGSRVYKTTAGKTVFRFNINKTFRTSDYRLVFYDPFSFVSCYSGATRKGNKTIRNATWDTTIGWILGFRENIVYKLDEYTSTDRTDNVYYTDPEARSNCVLVGDTTVSTNLYNYFLIKLDDYTQNHLNDGLVTITNQDTVLQVEPYSFVCDPYATSGSTTIAVPTSKLTDNAYLRMSKKELYTFNEKVQSAQIKEKSYSTGPFVKDIFGLIPMKTAGLINGTSYVEFGGTLQNQDRLYFGPVNIHRMTIQLLNDRGDLVDLNNSNWSFSLICEQLYKANL
jgi:hypothetical protein